MLLLSACGTNRYTHAAGQFGQLTKAATDEQNKRLSGIAADEAEIFHATLAEQGVKLKYRDCIAALSNDGAPRANGSPGCRIAILKGDGTFAELPSQLKLDNIIALNTALNDYAQSLVTLAGDSAADNQKFTNSLNGLATSLGSLDGAIRKASGSGSAAGDTKRFGAVAALVAKIGNLYFNGQRAAVLKRIIIESDPLIQQAVGLLALADAQLDLYDSAGLYDLLATAQEATDKAVASGNAAALRRAQDGLFDAVRAYNGSVVDRRRFEAIGKAHKALVEAAHSKASFDELQRAIEQLLDLASTVQETVTALDKEKK